MDKKTPKFRFKGFSDTWEQRKLGDIVNVYDGVHQTPNYTNSGVMFLSVEDITTLKSDKYISEEDFNRDYKIFPQQGDILMTRIGDIGTPNVVESTEKIAFYVSLALLKIKTGDPFFLCNAIQSPSFHNDLLKHSLTTAIPMKINKDEIGKVEIYVSPDLEEQKKIGSFFKNINNLITLHQRKLDKLSSLKKAYLEKMFPKKGKLYPELRFAGFTDAWEQRKFGSILKEIRDKTIVEDQDTLLSCAIDGMYLNSELFSHFRGSSNIGYLKIKKNDLILSAQNLHLGNCNVNLRFDHGIISPAYKVFELVNCDPLFMHAWVKQEATKNFFLKASTEGASVCRKNIVWEDLYKQELPLPNIKEQEKIGSFFSHFDNIITLHQRKLDKLKQIKSGYLNSMFI